MINMTRKKKIYKSDYIFGGDVCICADLDDAVRMGIRDLV